MGTLVRYLARRRAVRPVLVKARTMVAPSLVVARTADDASASVYTPPTSLRPRIGPLAITHCRTRRRAPRSGGSHEQRETKTKK